MAWTDRTSEFRKFTETDIAEPRRRRLRKDHAKEYVTEGYIVLNSINSLNAMLSAVRRPYLNVDTVPRRESRNIDFNSSWAQIKYLTNEERDQIDLQARITLSRCADKVKEMEAFEKRRVELVGNKDSAFVRFLPSRLRDEQHSLASKAVAAHHASITWYISRRLTEASQTQKEMQEERIKRQSERNTTLGSIAGREPPSLAMSDPLFSHTSSSVSPAPSSWLGQASSSLIASAIGIPSPIHSPNQTSSFPTPPIIEDDDEDDLELTEAQIQQFEQENVKMLKSVEDNLRAVQQAESRLLDISALQMELVSHLTQQTELTEQLYEDAISTTSMVERGNTQLTEAARRGKDSRLFLLVFLIGASLSLLFIHYY